MNEELKVIISAEIAKLKQGMEDAKQQINSFAQQVEKAKANVDKNIKTLGDNINKGFKVATATIAAGGAALVAYATKTAQVADAIDKNSIKLGISRQAYQELDYVLSQNGASIDSFGAGMKTLTAQLMSATSEAGYTGSAFDKLGVSVVDSNGNMRTQEAVLYDVIRAFQNMEDGAEKSALAQELFGKQGIELLPLLNAEAGSFDECAQRAHELGLIMDDELVDAGVALGDTMDDVKKSIGAIFTKLGGQLMPIVQQVCDLVLAHMPEIQAAISAVVDIISAAIGFVSEHLSLLTAIGVAIGVVVGAIELYNAIAAVKAAMDAAQCTSLTALIAAKMADAAATIAALAPYIAIVAAIAAVIAIIVVCIKHWDEIKEACAKAWETIKSKTKAAVDAVASKFNDMKDKASAKIEALKEACKTKFENIKSAMSEKMSIAKDAALNIFDAIKSGIQTKIELAKTIISNVLQAIKAVFTGDFGAAKDAVLNIFEAIKSGIQNKLDTAKNVVKTAIDAIKSVFNFSWSLPALKLPHISISGSFSINPPSVPHFGISWYAKGGVFDKTTLFPFGNSLGGLGEDGAEAVVPLEKNLGWLDKLAEMLNDRMGNKPIYLMVDKTVLGQVSADGINNITRLTGKMPLKVM